MPALQAGASKRSNSLSENELTSSPRATLGALSGLPSGDISCFPFKVEVKILPHPSFPPLAPPGTDDSERVLGPFPYIRPGSSRFPSIQFICHYGYATQNNVNFVCVGGGGHSWNSATAATVRFDKNSLQADTWLRCIMYHRTYNERLLPCQPNGPRKHLITATIGKAADGASVTTPSKTDNE